MPIETVSKLRSSKYRSNMYLFDVPSQDDEDALLSFLMIEYKGNIIIKRVTNLDDFIEQLSSFKSTEVSTDSKEYQIFLKTISEYIRQNRDNEEVKNELALISKNYIEAKRNLLKNRD